MAEQNRSAYAEEIELTNKNIEYNNRAEEAAPIIDAIGEVAGSIVKDLSPSFTEIADAFSNGVDSIVSAINGEEVDYGEDGKSKAITPTAINA